MKITFEKYNPSWKKQFESIKNELEENIGFLNPQIEHIGSTSVEGLSAKPVIDIMIGVKDEKELDMIPALMAGKDYVYYEKYNEDMSYRRFFIKLIERPDQLELPEVIINCVLLIFIPFLLLQNIGFAISHSGIICVHTLM